MRTEHSLKNISISLVSQLVMVILGFISRKVFLDSLGIEYLGLNGLLTNVISMMALVEGGIGLSIVYNLYKPLAENDQRTVIALVQLYKKAYGILAIIILIVSIVLFPFLDNIMKNGDSISNLAIIYFIFICKNMVSYLNAHKWSLINADQRGYVLAKLNLLFQVLTTISKIIILIMTKDFILYLLLELSIYIIQMIVNGKIVEKRYPYIKTKIKYSLDKETKTNIVSNVKALFLHNIGGFFVFGTDNILISSLIGVTTVGLYSNYTMITQQLSSLVSPVLGGIGASVGNLIATENSSKSYLIFKVSFLMNFWIYSVVVITLFNVLEPFINWWLGEGYLLNKVAFIVILINVYITGMRTAIATFKNTAGLFVQDKYIPLIEGLINLVASFILVKYLGLAGIFIGTTLSTLLTLFWTHPVIVYKNVFKRSPKEYFLNYCLYSFLTLLMCISTNILCSFLSSSYSLMNLFLKLIICLMIPNLVYLLLFYRTTEFKYLYSMLKNILGRRQNRKKFNKEVLKM
ncbi:lipopolysaccharide biosynthesis protein [Rossellomorea aquimaris]|uniref:O-antigen/teichoic acid export membrane protein n=1 Tax=Rossellomorea aquimaris TaxID=189382 RepID=A0A366ENU4_9BACI|nr:oligosaccharide flippase family protein [Rossellomorea aquimaris]RBP03159.1 O-antigen/teichoic acid export membrane protein [Rossellomorea aquimaris]